MRILFLSLILPFLLVVAPASARADDAAVQTTWRLIDYVAVDYREAVRDGRVVNQLEYDEMTEFTRSIAERIAGLPGHGNKDALLEEARALQAAVARRVAPPEIERNARALGRRLLAAYPVPLAPPSVPDLRRGAALYAENCAACHGAQGSPDPALAASMDPPPIDFTDRARAAERSPFALYQVIDQGLEGTTMTSFGHLPAEDVWALAFHVGRYAYPSALIEEGRRLWEGDAALRARIPDLETLAALTPAALAADIGEERANALTAFLRAHPETVAGSSGSGTLAIARERLTESLAAYRAGDRERASELVLSAYLDGFEPVEALLGMRDPTLLVEVEREMQGLRYGIGVGEPEATIASRIARLQDHLDDAEEILSPEASDATSTFLGAFAILLREGLEALLIVIAMITFLAKAGRRDLLAYVHGGWIAAMAAGIATWWAATHFITISGADRELTEGFGALLAAAVLLFVGVWMHGKAQAGAWQRYVKEKLDRALTRGSAWFLFGLAFVAVYREVFETIIFYAALGAQGQGTALAGGIAVAAVLLAAIAWAMLKFSARLPIAKFFAYSAALIAVLAVVLAGKGVSALQEAGLIGVTPLDGWPRSVILGVYPTAETMAAQAVMALLLLAGALLNRRRERLAPAPA